MASAFERALALESENYAQNLNLDLSQELTGWHSPKFKLKSRLASRPHKDVSSSFQTPPKRKSLEHRMSATYHCINYSTYDKRVSTAAIQPLTTKKFPYNTTKNTPKSLKCLCNQQYCTKPCESPECIMRMLTMRRNLFWKITKKGRLRSLQQRTIDSPKRFSDTKKDFEPLKKKMIQNRKLITSFVGNHKPRSKRRPSKFLEKIQGINLSPKVCNFIKS